MIRLFSQLIIEKNDVLISYNLTFNTHPYIQVLTIPFEQLIPINFPLTSTPHFLFLNKLKDTLKITSMCS